MADRAQDFRGFGVPAALWAPVPWVAVHALALLGLLLAAGITDLVFVFGVWRDGIGTLEAVLAAELRQAAALPCWCGDLQALAAAAGNAAYDAVFETSGIHAMAQQFAQPGALSVPDTVLRRAYLASAEEVRVLMLGTQLFGVRLGMLVAVVPCALIALLAGSADGWAQRAIRRAGGGAESAGDFHGGKYGMVVLVAGTAAGCLVVPVSVAWPAVWVTAGVFLWVSARVTSTYRKKWF